MSAAMSLSTNPVPAGDIRDKLIIGLDVPSVEEARSVVDRIGDAGTFYKIGYQLAYAGGFEFARELIGQGKKVFLDLKLHDIGNTVEEGVRSVARLGATFLTVHAYPQTMRAAVAGKAGTDLKILAVTVLTSYDDIDLVEAAGPEKGDLLLHPTVVIAVICRAIPKRLIPDRRLLGRDRIRHRALPAQLSATLTALSGSSFPKERW